MTDIFLSYASDDRGRIRPLVDGLNYLNFSVWWDRDITVGKRWDVELEEALNSAKCVIVVWSIRSSKSQWVSNEASEGMRRRILLPVLIDNVQIPLGFKHIQAANLIGWNGDVDNPEFRQLCHGVWCMTRKAESYAAATVTGHRADFLRADTSRDSVDATNLPYRTPPGLDPAPQATAITSDCVAGGLCYLMGPLSLLLLIARTLGRNRLVRFHAFQSTLLALGWLVLAIALHHPFLLFFTFLPIYISLAVSTFMGRTIKLPFIDRVARKLAD